MEAYAILEVRSETSIDDVDEIPKAEALLFCVWPENFDDGLLK